MITLLTSRHRIPLPIARLAAAHARRHPQPLTAAIQYISTYHPEALL